jgi:hypothetical protein
MVMEMALSTRSPVRTMDMGSDGTEGLNAGSEGPEEGGREQGVLAGGKGVGGRETFRAS